MVLQLPSLSPTLISPPAIHISVICPFSVWDHIFVHTQSIFLGRPVQEHHAFDFCPYFLENSTACLEVLDYPGRTAFPVRPHSWLAFRGDAEQIMASVSMRMKTDPKFYGR